MEGCPDSAEGLPILLPEQFCLVPISVEDVKGRFVGRKQELDLASDKGPNQFCRRTFPAVNGKTVSSALGKVLHRNPCTRMIIWDLRHTSLLKPTLKTDKYLDPTKITLTETSELSQIKMCIFLLSAY